MTSVVVIVNPAAGGGRALRAAAELRAAIAAAGAELATSTGPGDVERLAAAAARNGATRIVGVGGEGTVQELVNGVLDSDHDAAIGIVPGGNGNDLARALGLPRAALPALAVALHGPARPIDVGIVRAGGRTRHFVAAGGAGFDARVATRMAGARAWWQRGRAGYLLTTIDELRRQGPAGLRISIDDATISEAPILFAAFANGSQYGGGMRICPDAVTDDGWLDLCVVGDLATLEALRQLPGMYRGAHVGHRAVSMRRFRRLRIETLDGAVPIHLDGEPFGALPLEVEVAPGAIRVATPPPSATVAP